MTSRVKNVAVAGALSGAAAAVGGLATDPQSAWYRSLDLPSWQPPGVAFPVVWTGLYASVAGAAGQAVTAYEEQGRHREARALWAALAANLILNAGWSLTFFGRHRLPAANRGRRRAGDELVGALQPRSSRRPPGGPSLAAVCRVVHVRDSPHRRNLAPQPLACIRISREATALRVNTVGHMSAPAHAIDLAERLSQLSEHWSTRSVARLNDYEIKIVKLQGEFVWHSHDETDELFLVLSGELTIQLPDQDIVLDPGQLYVVPRGVQHCPLAPAEVQAVLIEPQGTVKTGTGVPTQ